MNPLVCMCQRAASAEIENTKAAPVVEAIRAGRWREPVEAIRAEYSKAVAEGREPKKAVAELKKALPGVLFSGSFSRRANAALVAHSGLLCADLDEVPDVAATKALLAKSPHCWAAFVSPTGTGIKAVFRVPADGEQQLASWRAVQCHVRHLCGLEIDGACKDVARLCFTSYDVSAHLNRGAVELAPLAEASKPLPEKNFAPAAPEIETRRRIAAELVGAIEWSTATRGLCACPGQHLHTTGNSERDCEIHLDGAPSLHCLHNSCRGLVDGASHELRSRIGKAEFVPNGFKPGRVANEFRREGEPDKTPLPLPEARAWIDIKPDGAAVADAILAGPGNWFTRGSGLLIVGPTGCGKSTLDATLAFSWALGREAVGLRPSRPLKSLVLQAEDDDLDLRDMARGIVADLAPTDDERATLRDNVQIVTERAATGTAFLARVAGWLELHQPDLLHFNPLGAFFGDDLNDQRAVAGFFRNALNPLLSKHRCGLICVHHCAKPSKERDGWRDGAQAYMGSGSADLPNWAREVLTLRQVAPGLYELAASKRWRKLGWTDADGKPSGTRLIAHARDGSQVWRDATGDTLAALGATPYTAAGLCALVPVAGIDKAALGMAVADKFSISDRTARNYIADLLRKRRHRIDGENAMCALLAETRKPRREVYPDQAGNRPVVWVTLTEEGKSFGKRFGSGLETKRLAKPHGEGGGFVSFGNTPLGVAEPNEPPAPAAELVNTEHADLI